MENYSPKSWVNGEIVYATDMNRIEQGIAAFYPQETIIAPEQTVTVTSETTPQTGVPITLAEGYELPEALPDNWVVTIDDQKIPYVDRGEDGAYVIDEDTVYISVFAQDGGLHLVMMAFGDDPSSAAPMVGDHTVKIMQTDIANPTVKAFPVSAGSGNVQFVIDAPKEDVDAAMVNGCVLLYAASPSASSGFAFGCLVGSVMYYAAGEDYAFSFKGNNVTVRDGKYAIAGLN